MPGSRMATIRSSRPCNGCRNSPSPDAAGDYRRCWKPAGRQGEIFGAMMIVVFPVRTSWRAILGPGRCSRAGGRTRVTVPAGGQFGRQTKAIHLEALDLGLAAQILDQLADHLLGAAAKAQHFLALRRALAAFDHLDAVPAELGLHRVWLISPGCRRRRWRKARPSGPW